MSGWSILYIILLAVGAIQGLVLGILLWRQQKRQLANRFLSLLLFFFAYRLIVEILASLGYVTVENFSYHIFLELNWAYGALLYFYAICFMNPARKLQRRDGIHLLPLMVEFIFSNYVKSQNFYWDGTRESLSWLGAEAYILWNHTPFQVLVFCGLMAGYSFYALRAGRRILPGEESRKSTTSWLRTTLWVYVVFGFGAMLCALIDYFFFDYAFQPFYVYPLYGGMALLTYVMGMLGFLHRNDPVRNAASVDIETLVDVDEKVKVLKAAMVEDKLFKNPKLTLNQLADAIEVKPYVLTHILNAILGVNFTDYVNQFRVEEVKRLVQDPDFSHYTLTAIGLEAGFNSKATFNRIFRKLTGKTPGEVKAELDNETA